MIATLFTVGVIISFLSSVSGATIADNSPLSAFRDLQHEKFKELHGEEFYEWMNSLADIRIVPSDSTARVLRNDQPLLSDSAESDTFVVTYLSLVDHKILYVSGTGLNTCFCGVNTVSKLNTCVIITNGGIAQFGGNTYYQLNYNYYNDQTNCNGESSALSIHNVPVSAKATWHTCSGASFAAISNSSFTSWTSFKNYPNGLMLFSYSSANACNDPSMPYFMYSYYPFPATCGGTVNKPWCSDAVGTFTTGNATTYPISTTTFGQTIYQKGGCTTAIATAQYTYSNPCINLHPDDDYMNYQPSTKATYQVPWNYDTYYVVGTYTDQNNDDQSSSNSNSDVTIPLYEYIVLFCAIGVAFVIGGIVAVLVFMRYQQASKSPMAHSEA